MKKLIVIFLFIPFTLVAQNKITFEVEKLEKPGRLLWQTSSSDLCELLIMSDANVKLHAMRKSSADFDYGIISHSQLPDSLVYLEYNSFFRGMHFAYADHRPFVLSPDMIWLLISQGFAQHVKNNAEALRSHFVDFSEKKILLVKAENDLLNGSRNSWEEIFPQFTKQIGENVGNELIDVLTCNFSSSTATAKVASEITVMEAMKPYFEFMVIRIVCGIPQITLEGTPDDWRKVLDKAKYLRKYDLAWWIDELIPYLEEFVKASEGKVNRKFWRNMFKYHTSKKYGVPDIDGWIVKFFPYDKHGNKNDLKIIEKVDNLPPEIVKVDLQYVEASATGEVSDSVSLELWAGFFGLEQNEKTFELKPQIGWVVRKKDVEGLALQAKLNMDNEAEHGNSISIQVKTVPEELLKMDSIRSLEIYFIDKVEIPDEMANLKIGKLTIHGNLPEEEKERIRAMFPNTELYFGNEEKVKSFKVLLLEKADE